MASFSQNWKEILTGVAGVLLLVLQIINVLLTNDVESSMNEKTHIMEQKAADIRTLVERNRSDLEVLHNELHGGKDNVTPTPTPK